LAVVFDDLNGLGIRVSTEIIFTFALFFYYTGTLKQCWYRRYAFPALFTVLAAMQWENTLNAILLLAAAVLTYYGFKGYGRKMLEEKEDKK